MSVLNHSSIGSIFRRESLNTPHPTPILMPFICESLLPHPPPKFANYFETKKKKRKPCSSLLEFRSFRDLSAEWHLYLSFVLSPVSYDISLLLLSGPSWSPAKRIFFNSLFMSPDMALWLETLNILWYIFFPHFNDS